MRTLTLPLKDGDIDTCDKRRRVCEMIAQELLRISKAERDRKERMPGNLACGRACQHAEHVANELFEAYLTVSDAFIQF